MRRAAFPRWVPRTPAITRSSDGRAPDGFSQAAFNVQRGEGRVSASLPSLCSILRLGLLLSSLLRGFLSEPGCFHFLQFFHRSWTRSVRGDGENARSCNKMSEMLHRKGSMRLCSACERPTSVKNLHFLFRKARCAIVGGIRARKRCTVMGVGRAGAFAPSVRGAFAPLTDDAFGKLRWPTAGSFAFEQRGAEARWEGAAYAVVRAERALA